MSDCGSVGSCGSCGSCGGCDCFGNSGNYGDTGAYDAPSNGGEIAACIETALDVATIGIDTCEAIPMNEYRKKQRETDADADEDRGTDTCQCIAVSVLIISVLGVIGKYQSISVDIKK